MSSVFIRVAVASLIIFASGCGGLYYMFSSGAGSDLLTTDTNNRRLDLSESEKALIRTKRSDLPELLDQIDEEDEEIDWDENWDQEEWEDVSELSDPVPDLATHVIAPVPAAQKSEEELTRELGPKLTKTQGVVTALPMPKKPDGSEIRERDYEFSKVKRDPQFDETEIQKLPDDAIAKTAKEHLILASPSDELWEIKHRQLQDYLKGKRLNSVGIGEWKLDKNTTKEQLAEICYKSYKSNPKTQRRLRSVRASVEFTLVWNWCTLPQNWSKSQPTEWTDE